MKKLFIILLSALALTAFAQQKKVAVYVTGEDAGINKVLGDQLVAAFAKSGRYAAIERTTSFLAELNKEQNYQHSGVVDDNQIARLGVQFGVNYVCVADITEAFGEKYISARLINVETAEIENTHNVSGEMNTMSACVSMASVIASNLTKGTFKEQAEDAKRREEERSIAAERENQKKIQALKNRDWKVLLDSRISKVTASYPTAWYIGQTNSDGQFNGLGLLFWTDDNTVYVGRFEKGSKDGVGMQVCPDGIQPSNCAGGKVYVGSQSKDKKQGTGSIYDKNGKLIYRGEFRFDKPTEEYPSSSIDPSYTYEVVDYDNGDKYVGEMKNGLRHGKGMYIWAEGNGIAWYGDWSNGTRDGYGIYIFNKGSNWSTGKWRGDTKL